MGSIVSSSGESPPSSVTSVSIGIIEEVYARLAPVYDVVFGRVLQAGRIAAVARMGHHHQAKILEVGVGTGLNTVLYPSQYQVTGIDISKHMLARAHQRIVREGLGQIRLVQMDAARLAFSDDSFDVVYAPYTISVVPDPVQTAREMRRVCRVGGTILILNHFRSRNPLISAVERIVTPLTVHIGFRSDLDLQHLLDTAGLTPASIEAINVPPLWRLVRCVKSA
jgi:phosphatidylethanolamine/phosphatidyl-N-methylethanolamine N-methyltransferase